MEWVSLGFMASWWLKIASPTKMKVPEWFSHKILSSNRTCRSTKMESRLTLIMKDLIRIEIREAPREKISVLALIIETRQVVAKMDLRRIRNEELLCQRMKIWRHKMETKKKKFLKIMENLEKQIVLYLWLRLIKEVVQ